MKLCDYRTSRNLTFDELAIELKLSKSTAWRICNGEGIDRDTAANVSALTGGAVTIRELLYPNGVPKGAVLDAPQSEPESEAA